jgi:hypothetical protein
MSFGTRRPCQWIVVASSPQSGRRGPHAVECGADGVHDGRRAVRGTDGVAQHACGTLEVPDAIHAERDDVDAGGPEREGRVPVVAGRVQHDEVRARGQHGLDRRADAVAEVGHGARGVGVQVPAGPAHHARTGA